MWKHKSAVPEYRLWGESLVFMLPLDMSCVRDSGWPTERVFSSHSPTLLATLSSVFQVHTHEKSSLKFEISCFPRFSLCHGLRTRLRLGTWSGASSLHLPCTGKEPPWLWHSFSFIEAPWPLGTSTKTQAQVCVLHSQTWDIKSQRSVWRWQNSLPSKVRRSRIRVTARKPSGPLSHLANTSSLWAHRLSVGLFLGSLRLFAWLCESSVSIQKW